jgi:hypothetical protein
MSAFHEGGRRRTIRFYEERIWVAAGSSGGSRRTRHDLPSAVAPHLHFPHAQRSCDDRPWSEL